MTKPSSIVLLTALTWLLAAAPATSAGLLCPDLSGSAWENATEFDAQGRAVVRFIPPELYAGAPWDGDRELALRPMRETHKPQIPSDHPAISIFGPMPSSADPDVPVLRRQRISQRQGAVVQEFAVNERGDGLGRLSDDRSARGRRVMAECFKFPLGLWRQGEERRCRESVIRILELDFAYGCTPHALKFRWNDEGTYIFAPGRGLVSVTH